MCCTTLLRSFCGNLNFHKIVQKLFIIGVLLQVLSCSHKDTALTTYKSNFTNQTVQALSGTEYRLNPIQDWQVANNRIECLVSLENRNVHLLTRELTKKEGDLEMQVSLGFFNKQISNTNKNWAGFCIKTREGSHDSNGYNSAINIGVSTNGTLFIGAPGPNYENKKVINTLSKGLNLGLTIKPNGKTYSLYVSIHDMETGALLSKISKKNVMPNQLIGDLVLVSNFEHVEGTKANKTKSVWFKDWKIGGTKIAVKPQRLAIQN